MAVIEVDAPLTHETLANPITRTSNFSPAIDVFMGRGVPPVG